MREPSSFLLKFLVWTNLLKQPLCIVWRSNYFDIFDASLRVKGLRLFGCGWFEIGDTLLANFDPFRHEISTLHNSQTLHSSKHQCFLSSLAILLIWTIRLLIDPLVANLRTCFFDGVYLWVCLEIVHLWWNCERLGLFELNSFYWSTLNLRTFRRCLSFG